jgi:hypothetical protein
LAVKLARAVVVE